MNKDKEKEKEGTEGRKGTLVVWRQKPKEKKRRKRDRKRKRKEREPLSTCKLWFLVCWKVSDFVFVVFVFCCFPFLFVDLRHLKVMKSFPRATHIHKSTNQRSKQPTKKHTITKTTTSKVWISQKHHKIKTLERSKKQTSNFGNRGFSWRGGTSIFFS